MTNREILGDFKSKYRVAVSDYRPLCADFVADMQGITIWTDKGDVILYFPKEGRRTDERVYKDQAQVV